MHSNGIITRQTVQNSLDSTGRSRLGPELVWKGPESVRRDQNLSGGTRIRLWGQNGYKNQEKWTLNTTRDIGTLGKKLATKFSPNFDWPNHSHIFSLSVIFARVPLTQTIQQTFSHSLSSTLSLTTTFTLLPASHAKLQRFKVRQKRSTIFPKYWQSLELLAWGAANFDNGFGISHPEKAPIPNFNIVRGGRNFKCRLLRPLGSHPKFDTGFWIYTLENAATPTFKWLQGVLRKYGCVGGVGKTSGNCLCQQIMTGNDKRSDVISLVYVLVLLKFWLVVWLQSYKRPNFANIWGKSWNVFVELWTSVTLRGRQAAKWKW